MTPLLAALLAAPLAQADPSGAAADEGSAEQPAPASVVELPPVELGGGLPSVVERLEREQRTLVRQRFGLRPTLAVVLATDDADAVGARLGGSVLHHWWTIPRKGLTWSGETTVGASGVVGGVRGWEAEASTVAGPWFGPVGLRAGPLLRGDRVVDVLDGTRLDDAFLLGLRAIATVDVDPVALWVGAAPAWVVAGDRAPGPLPGVTELEVSGGISGRIRLFDVFRLQPGLGTRVRLGALGPVTDLQLVLHVSAGPP